MRIYSYNSLPIEIYIINVYVYNIDIININTI